MSIDLAESVLKKDLACLMCMHVLFQKDIPGFRRFSDSRRKFSKPLLPLLHAGPQNLDMTVIGIFGWSRCSNSYLLSLLSKLLVSSQIVMDKWKKKSSTLMVLSLFWRIDFSDDCIPLFFLIPIIFRIMLLSDLIHLLKLLVQMKHGSEGW